jgi:hypothetical protein
MIKKFTITVKNNFVKVFYEIQKFYPLNMLVPLLELLLHLLLSLIEVILLIITQFILLFAMAYPLIKKLEPSLERQLLQLRSTCHQAPCSYWVWIMLLVYQTPIVLPLTVCEA